MERRLFGCETHKKGSTHDIVVDGSSDMSAAMMMMEGWTTKPEAEAETGKSRGCERQGGDGEGEMRRE